MTSNLRFDETYKAWVTPFTPDGSAVDYGSLNEMVEWQIQEGIDGSRFREQRYFLLVWGPQEKKTLVYDEERLQVIKTAIETVDGRVPVIAGTGALRSSAFAAPLNPYE
ncbi:hypothetical protein PInf_010919 [Phytophthora infestans]|nr:hypothetical protein PInf_010919 [Phytophthora infestans]